MCSRRRERGLVVARRHARCARGPLRRSVRDTCASTVWSDTARRTGMWPLWCYRGVCRREPWLYGSRQVCFCAPVYYVSVVIDVEVLEEVGVICEVRSGVGRCDVARRQVWSRR
jgi:hypothetical protein